MSSCDHTVGGDALKIAHSKDLECHKADLVKQVEWYKETLIRERMHYEASIKTDIEMVSSLNVFAGITIKSLILINGGAVLALLTFVQAVATKDGGRLPASALSGISGEIKFFIVGLVCAIITSFFSYVAQAAFLELPRQNHDVVHPAGVYIRYFAVLCGAGSVYFFCYASYNIAVILENIK